jgi:uncharacterized OsmC-like protein
MKTRLARRWHAPVSMNNVVSRFALRIEPIDGFEYRVRFDKNNYPELRLDEPAPLGKDSAPNPARLLRAAVGDCLTAGLLFCLKRAGAAGATVSADVQVEIERNERKRLRIGRIAAELHPAGAIAQPTLDRCIADFEDLCIVTQSVREGLDVRVTIGP